MLSHVTGDDCDAEGQATGSMTSSLVDRTCLIRGRVVPFSTVPVDFPAFFDFMNSFFPPLWVRPYRYNTATSIFARRAVPMPSGSLTCILCGGTGFMNSRPVNVCQRQWWFSAQPLLASPGQPLDAQTSSTTLPSGRAPPLQPHEGSHPSPPPTTERAPQSPFFFSQATKVNFLNFFQSIDFKREREGEEAQQRRRTKEVGGSQHEHGVPAAAEGGWGEAAVWPEDGATRIVKLVRQCRDEPRDAVKHDKAHLRGKGAGARLYCAGRPPKTQPCPPIMACMIGTKVLSA